MFQQSWPQPRPQVDSRLVIARNSRSALLGIDGQTDGADRCLARLGHVQLERLDGLYADVFQGGKSEPVKLGNGPLRSRDGPAYERTDPAHDMGQSSNEADGRAPRHHLLLELGPHQQRSLAG